MKIRISILCLLLNLIVIGQNGFFKKREAKVLIENGDVKMQEGDYYGAVYFYELAYEIDSLSEGLVYRLGLSNKGFHKYKEAKKYFDIIEKSLQLKTDHPEYKYHQADILKREEEYSKSEKVFKSFMRSYKIKNDIYYRRAKQEVKSFPRVYKLLKDTQDVVVSNLGQEINSGAAELNSVFTSDTSIVFNTLRSLGPDKGKEVDKEKYKLQLYKAVKKDSVWRIDSQYVKVNDVSISNGSIDTLNQCFYFSLYSNESNSYSIYRGELKNGKPTINKSEKLSINTLNSSSKNPHLILQKKKQFLVFTSNRKGGRGGWDLWYSEFKREKWSNPKNLGTKVNSLGDEVSPFFDQKKRILYFASDWHYNLGGFDVFKAVGNWKKPNAILNLGIPINSSENDLYYSPKDEYQGLFTSSRKGSISDDETVCCNDLYAYQFPKPNIIPLDSLDLPNDEATMLRLQKLIEEYHVTLYFHNDRPNPDNWDTITPYDYLETYRSYIKRIPTYRSEYSKRLTGADSLAAVDEIQDFFDDYVHRGVNDLKVFTDEIIKELDAGNKIELSVKGYASPLAKSDYNVNLTLRRINTLQNYLRRYPGGVFNKYLDNKASNGGYLKIVKVPFGEYRSDTTVSDNFYDTRNSVYSKGAALERKIEIINLQLINDSVRKEIPFSINLDSSETVIDIGKMDTTKFNWRFHMVNNTDSVIKIDSVNTSCHCMAPKRKEWVIQPKEIEPLDIEFDLEGYSGLQGRIITIYLNGGEVRRLKLLFELD